MQRSGGLQTAEPAWRPGHACVFGGRHGAAWRGLGEGRLQRALV